VKFNTVAIAAGVTRGTWPERPKVGPETQISEASDGDYFQVEGGAVYRYSSEIDEFVRPFVYAGTPVLDIKLRGSVLPTAESPAWHSVLNGVESAMTTDGTHVSHGVGGSGFSEGVLHYNHGQYQKTHFFQGHIEQTTPDFHTGLAIKDGLKMGWVVMGARTDGKRMFLETIGLNGGSLRDERIYKNSMQTYLNSAPPNRYLELYLAASGSTKGLMVYVDHELNPSLVCDYENLIDHGEYSDNIDNSTHIAASASIYYIGQRNARNQIRTMRMKECFFGRY